MVPYHDTLYHRSALLSRPNLRISSDRLLFKVPPAHSTSCSTHSISNSRTSVLACLRLHYPLAEGHRVWLKAAIHSSSVQDITETHFEHSLLHVSRCSLVFCMFCLFADQLTVSLSHVSEDCLVKPENLHLPLSVRFMTTDYCTELQNFNSTLIQPDSAYTAGFSLIVRLCASSLIPFSSERKPEEMFRPSKYSEHFPVIMTILLT